MCVYLEFQKDFTSFIVLAVNMAYIQVIRSFGTYTSVNLATSCIVLELPTIAVPGQVSAVTILRARIILQPSTNKF